MSRSRPVRARSLLVLGAVVIAGGCTREPARPRKTHLVVMPASFRERTVAVGEDGTSWVFVLPTADGLQQPRHAAGSGPALRRIFSPQLAPRTGRLFYWGTTERDDLVLVADGAIVVRGLGRPGVLVFSRDGSRWAAAARVRGDEDGDRGPVVVAVDGREQGVFGDASLPSFSPDARHLSYLVTGDGGTLELVVDGERRTTYAPVERSCERGFEPPAPGPTMSPRLGVRYLADGSLLVVARDRDGWAVYRDGTRLASYPVRSLPVGQASFAPGDPCATAAVLAPTSVAAATDAPVAAWWERPAAQELWRVVVDGRPVDRRMCQQWWQPQPPELSPDGRHVAYPCAGPNGDVFVVFDDRELGPYREVWGFTVSDDGRHVAYGASEDGGERSWAIYVDGQRRTRHYHAVWRPRFAPRGGRIAWEAEPTSRARGRLGLDGRELLSFDEVLWGPRFTSSGTVAWVIRHGRKITRIDVPTP